MKYDSRQQGLESVLALNLALHGARDKPLTPQQSQKNIEDNVVRICQIEDVSVVDENGKGTMTISNSASGLQITTDGFIITAAHVIEDWIANFDGGHDQKYAVLKVNNNGDVERISVDTSFYIYNQTYDVALIKIIGTSPPRPILFNLKEETRDAYLSGKKVAQLTRNNSSLSLAASIGQILNPGTSPIVRSENGLYRQKLDCFGTTIRAEPGDSGSPIIGENGALLGITVSSANGKDATCAKIGYAIDLARKTIYSATRRLFH